MMKLFNYGIGCSAMLLAAILSGCSSDEPLVQKNPVAEKDETRFIVVSLNSPSEGTRTFEYGTKNENAVNRLDFLFYDSEGNQVGEPYTFNSSDLDSGFTNQVSGNNVARIWTQVVPVNIQQGKTMPAQVICLVNAAESRATALKGKSLIQLLDIKDGSFYNGDHFVMTNSSFYKDGVRYCATPVQSAQMFSDTSAANKVLTDLSGEDENKKEAAKKLLVDIFVERSAAKVGLTLAEPEGGFTYSLANGEGSGDITLHFKPQYWFMNAVDKEMYSTKRFGIPLEDGSGISMDPLYDAIDAKFSKTGMSTSWNDETNSRSYWGCSPSYAANQFPLVSDNVYDLVNDKNESYTKYYYSFNDLKNSSNTGLGTLAIPYNNGFSISTTGNTSTGYIYTTETTTSITRINDAANSNPAAVVGSAVIVGHYYAGDTEPSDEYPTFWIDANDGEKGKYYATELKAKKTLIARNSFIFSDAIGSSPVKDASSFVLVHPVKAVRKLLTDKDNIAGRLVTLQLAEVPSSKLYFWDGTQFAEITTTNLAKANAALAGVGYLDMYNNGRAFFNIPVRHLGWPENDQYTDDGGAVKKLYEKGVYNWANMRLGDLGIVRNHVYTINVTKIEGLGSGLRDDDQPIVPPVHAFKQYVAVRLNILKWNVVKAYNIGL